MGNKKYTTIIWLKKLGKVIFTNIWSFFKRKYWVFSVNFDQLQSTKLGPKKVVNFSLFTGFAQECW